jgi:hypothetical protein
MARVQLRNPSPGRPGHRPRTGRLLRTQEGRRQGAHGSNALRQAPAVRHRLPDDVERRRARHRAQVRRGPGRTTGTRLRLQRDRLTSPHRLFGQVTSRTRNSDATRRCDPREPPRGLGSSPPASTRRSRQGGVPHRTNDLDRDKRRRTIHGAETASLTVRGARSLAAGSSLGSVTSLAGVSRRVRQPPSVRAGAAGRLGQAISGTCRCA